jgi:protein involved in polysaccharide export with SLBB domain
MNTFVKVLIGAAALSLAFGAARAADDGFAPPEAAPTQRVATSDLSATGNPAMRAWTPDTDVQPQPRYATQASSQPIAPPAAQASAPQTRYASQAPQSQPVLQQQPQPAPVQQRSRYSTQMRPTDLAPSRMSSDPGYHLGSGDKVRVIVYGEDDLGGEFEVDGSGFVRLPLVGQVQAAGLTVHDFEQMVMTRLSDGYLRDPHVSAEVTTYRPFYIIGEVNKPGEYAYVNGMNVVTAVALAGGYTYRATDDDVHVRRNGSQKEEELPANERTIIYPGDIIRVAERFF